MSGVMTAIAASIGDIDTSDQLNIFEAYGKIMIVNGSNLKVADFVNTKLTHAALATAHAHGDVLTQATSGATMVVDFTNTSKTATYGFVTSGTFDATHEVTGSGSGSAFTPSAVTANPHWYDWTVYPGGTFGSMPEKAYLGCLYRGRCVLSGNPNYPYQWYMSRQANPWDWAYVADDAQSPVAGQDADAGEMGDVITALIPWSDEYLIFGGSHTIWVLKGDPAEAGVLQEVDLTKGIFGAQSWCFDDEHNLYFASTTGIHILPAGWGPIVDISSTVLPNLLEDIQPDTHRVLLAYDRQNGGILITITALADGSNTNYFYDLTTKGFFKETYPITAGVFSMLTYDPTDKDYAGLLLGGADGYIRVHDDDTKSDATTSGTTTISSSMTLPFLRSEDGNNRLKIISEAVTLSGGAADGTFTDSDGVTMQLFSAEDAETLLENIKDGDTPLHSVTFTGPGKAVRSRNRVVGDALAIRFINNTIDQSFSLERVTATVKEIKRY
jgi:hypothetical protein